MTQYLPQSLPLRRSPRGSTQFLQGACLVTVGMWIGACAGEQTVAPNGGYTEGKGATAVDKLVGAEGSTLATKNVKITIPPGALSKGVQISLTELSSAEEEALPAVADQVSTISPAARFKPHGLSFDEDVDVELQTPAGASPVRPVVLKLDDEQDQSWEKVEPVQFAGVGARFKTRSFSIYRVFDDPEGLYDAATGSGGSGAGGATAASGGVGQPSAGSASVAGSSSGVGGRMPVDPPSGGTGTGAGGVATAGAGPGVGGASTGAGGASTGAGGVANAGGAGGSYVPDPNFDMTDPPNAGVGLAAVAYLYQDSAGTSLKAVQSIPGEICLQGVIPSQDSDPNVWGGGFGLQLVAPPGPVDVSTHGGFSYVVSGTLPAQLRAEVLLFDSQAGQLVNDGFFDESSYGLLGYNSVDFMNVAQGSWVGAPIPFDTQAVGCLQFHVVPDLDKPTDVNFCISDVQWTPLP